MSTDRDPAMRDALFRWNRETPSWQKTLSSAFRAGWLAAPRDNVDEAVAAIKFAAHEWWRRNMTASEVVEVHIAKDGRVDVIWIDDDETGRYTLPVDFMEVVR